MMTKRDAFLLAWFFVGCFIIIMIWASYGAFK